MIPAHVVVPWCTTGAAATTPYTTAAKTIGCQRVNRCPASNHSRNATHTNSGDTTTAASHTTPSPSSHHRATRRERAREARATPTPHHSAITSPAAIAGAGAVPWATARTTPIAVSTPAITCWPMRSACRAGAPPRCASVSGRGDGSVGAASMRSSSVLVVRSVHSPVYRTSRPPHPVTEQPEQRGHHHRTHHHGVHDHPDADDHPELAERDQRQHPERGEHRGQHDPGTGDHPTG